MIYFDWAKLSAKEQNKILQRPAKKSTETIQKQVQRILSLVQNKGDRALRSLTKIYDGVQENKIIVGKSEIFKIAEKLPLDKRKSIQIAYDRIKHFHEMSRRQAVNWCEKDFQIFRQNRPIDSVGLYVPNGSAPLPSTLLMLSIPAKVAQCPRVVLCTPPGKNRRLDPSIAYAALISGIEEIYLVGGAQAIAAMAFGTQTVPKVEKIFGPGNIYVTEAKKIVSQTECAIDMLAGPSEVLIVADQFAKPEFVACDLLSQAEHDENAQVFLISDCRDLMTKVDQYISEQICNFERRDIIKKSLKNARLIISETINEAIRISNDYAPEHLILNLENSDKWLPSIRNAGSVFLGAYTPESAGDYASGTNHVLPTYGQAKSHSGLSVDSFEKTITFQKFNRQGLQSIRSAIEDMAQMEGLTAHKEAVNIRLRSS